MKLWRLLELLARLLNAVRVEPAREGQSSGKFLTVRRRLERLVYLRSVKDHPPTDIHVCNEEDFALRPVKRLYKDAALPSMGAI